MLRSDALSTLGLSDPFTEKELKKAYKRLASKHHPDKFSNGDEIGKQMAAEQFRKAKEAYEYLEKFPEPGSQKSSFGGYSDDDLRKAWEQKMNQNDDIFSRFRKERTKEINQTIFVTLEQVHSGTVYVLKVEQRVRCEKCQGVGVIVRDENKAPLRCGACGQKGFIDGTTDHKVTIPKNIMDGETIEHDVNVSSMDTRKYIIKVRHKNHDVFTTKGKDLYRTVDVPLTTALMGGMVSFNTIDGVERNYKIPPKTQGGAKFKFSNHGLGGDLYVTVNIIIPYEDEEFMQTICPSEE